MLEDLKKDATVRMQKCVAAFKEQLKKLRTGRAHTSLIEHIKVDYYGSEMPLNQVARSQRRPGVRRPGSGSPRNRRRPAPGGDHLRRLST
jgi:hypothetical protein